MADDVKLNFDIKELTGLFQRTKNFDQFLQSVVSAVAYHMKAAVCSVYFYDPRANDLVLVANQGLASDAIGRVRLSQQQGLIGLCYRENRSLCEGSVFAHPDFMLIPGINEELYESLLAVPLERGGDRLGVLAVQDPQPNYFEHHEESSLVYIAKQIVKPIQDAKILIDAKTEQAAPGNFLEDEEPLFIKGISGSDGLCRGEAVLLNDSAYDVFIAMDEEDGDHVQEFEQALEKTERQLSYLQQKTEEELADVASLIFSAHLLMLMDEAFTGEMRSKIQEGMAPQRAVVTVVNEYINLFSDTDNSLVNEKVQDLKDLGHRLLMNLSPNTEDDEADYHGQIIIASDLLPSELLKLATQNAEAIIITQGGVTAHISILATSLQMPLVMADDHKVHQISEGTELIVDATQGSIFVRPDEAIRQRYEQLISDQKSLEEISCEVTETTETADGERVRLLANINLLSDLNMALSLKAEGVGLYRSEFPFLVRSDFPTEEEQYRVYNKIISSMDGSAILRTLDIGGDKLLPYGETAEEESNPFLGMRGIRYLLRNKPIFVRQIRAMLRAGYETQCRIMFPMVSSVDNFIQARDQVNECIGQLQKEQIPHNSKPELGIMIEVPSAVEVIDELAAEADFFSIGTNDLVQYMLAVDRTNEKVSGYYTPFHPAVLRAIKKVVVAANNADIEVSICGNMAGNQRMIPFLLGVGVRKLSLDPRRLPDVQRFIRRQSLVACRMTAEQMLKMGQIRELRAFLDQIQIDPMPTVDEI